ncbi:MAG TPA: gliding motility-associated C-terminal domain-containing protein [Bacteroidales bacterium]|nr:gliding motility-associated C-terminal domain-containing protein [Bacteroidales bacterium]
MNDLLNNGPRNFDDYLKNAFDNYQPDVSSDLWSSLSPKLLKKDVYDFVTFKKLGRSFSSQSKIGAAQIKVLATYAAAACLAVGVVFGASRVYKNIFSDNPEKVPAKEKIITAPVKPESAITEEDTEIATLPPLTNTAGSDNKAQQPNQEATIPVSNNITKDNQAVTNTVVGESVQTKPQQNNSTNDHTALLNYIDRVNSKDPGGTVDEPATQDFPETIDITIEENNNNVVPADENEPYAYNLEIPNVITPNSDGFNDYFKIKNLDKYSYNSLTIADRSGKVVFEVVNYQNNWDAPNIDAGTYYYVLSYKDNKQNQGVIKGTLSIIR